MERWVRQELQDRQEVLDQQEHQVLQDCLDRLD